MANKVNVPPLVPRPSNIGTIANIGIFLTNFIKSMFDELFSHGIRLNNTLPLDGTEPMQAPLVLASYATADLPAAASWTGAIVYDTTTSTVKRSNGSVWTSL